MEKHCKTLEKLESDRIIDFPYVFVDTFVKIVDMLLDVRKKCDSAWMELFKKYTKTGGFFYTFEL